MKLTGSGKVSYSKAEKALFELLSMREHRSTSELVQLRFGETNVPFHAADSIRAAARSLARKVVVNDEPFIIAKSTRRGPYPVEFWIEEKGAKQTKRKKA